MWDIKAGPLSDGKVIGKQKQAMMDSSRAWATSAASFEVVGGGLDPPQKGVYHCQQVFVFFNQGHVGKVNLPVLSWDMALGLVGGKRSGGGLSPPCAAVWVHMGCCWVMVWRSEESWWYIIRGHRNLKRGQNPTWGNERGILLFHLEKVLITSLWLVTHLPRLSLLV